MKMKEFSHGLRFLIEIVSLILVIYIGFKHYSGIFKVVIGVLFPIIVIVLWSIFMAPKSQYRLDELQRLFFEILLFGSISGLLFYKNESTMGLSFTLFAIVSTIMDHIYK